jgi:hypothetical protein
MHDDKSRYTFFITLFQHIMNQIFDIHKIIIS